MKIRLAPFEVQQLLNMGMRYIVVVAKDVSVVSPGALDSAFGNRRAAEGEAERLCELYSMLAAFIVIDLNDCAGATFGR